VLARRMRSAMFMVFSFLESRISVRADLCELRADSAADRPF